MYHECIDSWDKYYETSITPKENFFNKLENNGISDRD